MDALERKRWDLQGTVQFIKRQSYKKIALQFPDDLLGESHVLYHELRLELWDSDPSIEVR
jgi:diphthamide biosynthesis enzyme Dph1/Dph2-like protein